MKIDCESAVQSVDFKLQSWLDLSLATLQPLEYLAQAAARPPQVLSAPPPQPQKRPVGRPRKVSINDELEKCDHHTERPRKRSTDDSEQENSSNKANEPKQVRRQYSYKQKERVVDYTKHHGVRAAA